MVVEQIIHIILLVLLPPLLLGIINKTKAFFAGRVGFPVLQPYYDIIKLLRKNLVISKTTRWVFVAGPVITVIALLVAGFLIPLGNIPAPVRFTGDLILFAYLFALTRFLTTAAALDTGSAFEGMGAAREVTFAVFAEPALFIVFLTLVKLSGSLSLTRMLQSAPVDVWGGWASLLLVSASLYIILLTENCRIPVDDPNTHLELTMIHEVMVLDHSGPLLGLVEYGSALKLFILGTVLVNIVMPFHVIASGYGLVVYLGGLFLLSIVVGITESIMARLPMVRVPHLLVAAGVLSMFGLLLLGR